MHRSADSIVFLENDDRPAVGGQTTSGRQPARAAADDRYIPHAGTII